MLLNCMTFILKLNFTETIYFIFTVYLNFHFLDWW